MIVTASDTGLGSARQRTGAFSLMLIECGIPLDLTLNLGPDQAAQAPLDQQLIEGSGP